MSYVYILRSTRNGKYYIGSTTGVQRRFLQHQRGNVYSTRRLLPVELAFSQQFANLGEAREIERRLKKFKRHDIVARIIENGKIELQGP
jgi:putative endonuclease